MPKQLENPRRRTDATREKTTDLSAGPAGLTAPIVLDNPTTQPANPSGEDPTVEARMAGYGGA